LLRKTLVSQLQQTITVSGEESGLHLVVELPDHVDDIALESLAAESGISVKALSRYYIAPPVRRGLLVGYAYVNMDKIVYYGKLLAHAIQAQTKS
jgi:GntR family transcriptional regulator/MocR family aminotransferase